MPSDKGTEYDKQLVTTGLLLAQKKTFCVPTRDKKPRRPSGKLDEITTYSTWLIKRFVIMMTFRLSLAGNLALAMSFFRLLVIQNKRAVCS